MTLADVLAMIDPTPASTDNSYMVALCERALGAVTYWMVGAAGSTREAWMDVPQELKTAVDACKCAPDDAASWRTLVKDLTTRLEDRRTGGTAPVGKPLTVHELNCDALRDHGSVLMEFVRVMNLASTTKSVTDPRMKIA